MRIIITGPEKYPNKDFLMKKLTTLTSKIKKVVVVSGHRKGVERLSEQWAFEQRHNIRVHHIEKNETKKHKEMIEEADVLIVFPGKDKPSEELINLANKKKIKVRRL